MRKVEFLKNVTFYKNFNCQAGKKGPLINFAPLGNSLKQRIFRSYTLKANLTDDAIA